MKRKWKKNVKINSASPLQYHGINTNKCSIKNIFFLNIIYILSMQAIVVKEVTKKLHKRNEKRLKVLTM